MSVLAPSLTESGKQLIARGIAGETILFTRIEIGDGKREENRSSGIGNAIVSLAISGFTRKENYVELTAEAFNNSTLERGFYMRELGVYVQDGESEVLFAYSHTGDDADFIPAASSEVVLETQLSVIVAVGTAGNVTAVLTESVANDPITFDVPEEMEELNSGDTVKTLFGKIKRWLTDLREEVKALRKVVEDEKVNIVVSDETIPVEKRKRKTFYFFVERRETIETNNKIRVSANMGIELVDGSDATGKAVSPFMRIEIKE